MYAVINRCRESHRNRNTICGIGSRGDHSTEIIAHHLLAKEIRASHRHTPHFNGPKTILCKLLIVLVVTVVAATIGVVGSCIYAPLIVEDMAYDQLIIRLRIVVGMVVIVAHNLAVDDNLTLRVVATIFGHLLRSNARIGESDLRHTSKR